MRLDVSKLKQESIKLTKLEEDYENVYLNYYNVIKDIDSEWNNKYEKRLMQNIEDEKKQMNLIFNNLKDINGLYSYICNKYSFCNKISINVDNEDMIIKKIDNCISHLKKIKNLCNTINTKDMDDNKLNIFNDTKYKMEKELEKMVMLKGHLQNIFDKINQIETDIKVKISEISTDIINETDISEFIDV